MNIKNIVTGSNDVNYEDWCFLLIQEPAEGDPNPLFTFPDARKFLEACGFDPVLLDMYYYYESLG